ncbi:MAG TPA: choice-of-anchor D domain-containing protein, partial [Patescibacteria group bacterium]|nr:choice-of-anchor D domain-containing protein [Patescibacteria group bacterium]
PLNAEIRVNFGCSLVKNIAVSGDANSVFLLSSGWDFRSVRVGNTQPHRVYVTNVSTGNATMIRLDSLVCVSCTSDIIVDTNGVFPYDIKTGDTLFLNARFTPSEKGLFRNLYTVANTPHTAGLSSVRDSFTIVGNGVAPQISAADLDFKKRRVGTTNDSNLIIRNNGDDIGIVTVKRISQNFQNILTADTIGLFPALLNTAPPLSLPVTFIPDKVGFFKDSIICAVDWQFHEPVIVSYYGEGTLPGIKTDSLYFTTIEAGQWSDTTLTLIYSTGNEALTIDTIIALSGDTEVFDINTQWSASRIVEPQTGEDFTVSFKPQQPRTYSAVFAVVHDAMPAFGRDTAYILIQGSATSKSNLDTIKISVDTDILSIYTCRDNEINLTFKNNSNTGIIVDSIEVTDVNSRFTQTSVPVADVFLMIGESTNISGRIYTDQNDSITLFFRYYCRSERAPDETIIIVDSITLPVSKNTITIVAEPSFSGTPGGYTDLKLSGKIDAGTDQEFLFSINLEIDEKLLQLSSKIGTLHILMGAGEISVPVSLIQERNTITVRALQSVVFTSGGEWKLSIPFEVMLGIEFDCDVQALLAGNECYNPDSTKTTFIVNDVCSPYTRRVNITNDFAVMAISPNPATDGLVMDIMMPEDGTVDIQAIDILGNVFSLQEKLYLTNGRHSCKLDIRALQSGTYTIASYFKTSKQHTLIIITK